MKIAIIGGGFAGLGAAYELKESGKSVVLFERSPELGGLASSFVVNGVAFESFYHHMFPTYHDFFEVAPKIGVKEKIYFKKASTANVYEGKTYPFNSALDLLRYTPLSFFDRLRTGVLIAFLKYGRHWEKFENVTAVAWLRRNFGENAYKLLWEPLLVSKFADKAKSVGMVWFWSRIFERPSKFGYFKGGFKVMVDALESELVKKNVAIRKSAEVKELRKEGDQFMITTSHSQELFDAVVVAAPPLPFNKMASNLIDDEFKSKLALYQYTGTICAILVLKNKLSRHYWTNVQDLKAPFVAVVEQTNFVPEDTYGGYHPVYLSRYISPNDPLYQLQDDALWDRFIPYLKSLYPNFSEDQVIEKKVFRAPFTQPIVPSQYCNLRPAYRTPVTGLWWVSMSHIYPWDRGTDHSFHAGRELARELISGKNA